MFKHVATRLFVPVVVSRPLVVRRTATSVVTASRRFSTSPVIMSSPSIILSQDAPAPVGPYSQAVKVGNTIYCSGQVHLKDGALTRGSIGEKTAVCIENLKAVLIAGGSSIDKVVKVNAFLADMGDFKDFNAEYAKWFTHKPARSCVAVKTLPLGADVEIECIALA